MGLENLLGRPTHVVKEDGTPDYGTISIGGREMHVIAVQQHSDGTESLLLENDIVLPAGRVFDMTKYEQN